MDKMPKCLISVIIPVYNTGNFLLETLDSVAEQTFPQDLMEVLVVNDASTDPVTIKILRDIEKKPQYRGIDCRVLHHQTNQWLAQTRNTGVRAARGVYICTLDSDDLIKPDFLQKSLLTLLAHPHAGWVYPGVQKFGYVYSLDYPVDFSAPKFFWNNYCVSASLLRRDMWERVGGQRKKTVVGKIKWFEDWDFWIRAMGKGFYGVPLREIQFLYRQHLTSLIQRSPAIQLLTYYLIYRSNFLQLFRIQKAQRNMLEDNRQGTLKKRSPWRLSTYMDRLSGILLKFAAHRSERYYSFRMLLMSLLFPKKFITEVLSKKEVLTKAEFLCGFREKLPVTLTPLPAAREKGKFRTVLFGHYWWHLGGGDNILLDWMRSTYELKNTRCIDLVKESAIDNGFLEDRFEPFAASQYALDRMANNPLAALLICWNLICLERPEVIFIMSNPFLYVLSPWIKRYFPETKIVDLLHCEDNNDPGWFAISDEYREFLDKRVVTSDFWKTVLVEKYGEDPGRIDVAYNGVDLTRFDPKKHPKLSLRKDFKLPADKIIVGFLGRFDYQKNPFTFLETADLMLEDRAFHFVMIGKGTYDEQIKERLKRLSNVTYLGFTKNPERYYPLFDVAVYPSVYEGFPMVGLESAAMNVPVIATDIVGFREQIGQGKFGFLYTQEDPKKDAKKIRDLLYEHRSEWSDIGNRGRPFIKQHHDFAEVKKVYQRIMTDLLDG